MWTLVIVTTLSHFDDVGSVSVHSVSGFSTEQACLNAANKLILPSKNGYGDLKYALTCVSKDV